MSDDEQRQRLIYAAVAAVVFGALVAVVVVLSSGGGESGTEGASGDAFIETLSGSTNDLVADERLGTTPPEATDDNLEAVAAAAGCELELDLRDEGNTHIGPGDPPPDYETDPPTSGDHIAPPMQQADGAYGDYAEPVNTVHSLEHGRVAVQYSPDLPEAEQLALKGVFDEDPAGMLLFPNPEMGGAVAVSAWANLARCDAFQGDATLDLVRAFRDTYRGNGPEAVPIELSG